jgi:uncharacterized zinc-type alcohol dehydrogenase-like protein
MFQAYAATRAGGEIGPFEYDPGPLGPYDVEIDVETCGICHSDLSMLKNEWAMTQYPFVGGHEVVGTVAQAGEAVISLQPGESVGLGWHAGYCLTCDQCLSGNHNLCGTAEQTIVGRHGGFGNKVRAHATSVFALPEGIDPDRAGPLLCGGITVFNPLVQFGIRPTDSVAVLGIGGLGHLALQFAKAWGCHVTALTSESKLEEAVGLGAHEALDSRDDGAIANARGRFDLILCTVNVPLDWNSLLATLKPKGRLHLLGVVPKPLGLNMVPMLFHQLSVSSSPVGSPATIREMLRFCARHGIAPVTEPFAFDQINEAMDHLESGRARYRVVLSHN